MHKGGAKIMLKLAEKTGVKFIHVSEIIEAMKISHIERERLVAC